MAIVPTSKAKRFEGLEVAAKTSGSGSWAVFRLEAGAWRIVGYATQLDTLLPKLSRRLTGDWSQLTDKDIECILTPIERLAWLAEENG